MDGRCNVSMAVITSTPRPGSQVRIAVPIHGNEALKVGLQFSEYQADTFEAVLIVFHPFFEAVSIRNEQFVPATYPDFSDSFALRPGLGPLE
jgi:hypothetical protein